MPLKLTPGMNEGGKISALNRWADYVETQLRGTKNEVAYTNQTTVTQGTQISGGGGSGTVTSVAATVPSWLSVSGSPITTTGTLAITSASGLTANEVLATPNGTSGTLALRALVIADLPFTGSASSTTFARGDGTWATPSGSGTVTSVALSVPSWLTVTGSPITSSGTLAVSATTGETANEFLATPNGSTGAVGLRAIVLSDLPFTGSASSSTYARGDGTWATIGSGGTVTTTGSPSNGNLTKFSGSTSITNADLTGDITTSGGVATTLATVNTDVGTYTNATVTVNAKGLVTAASSGSGYYTPNPTSRRWAYGASVSGSNISGNVYCWVGDNGDNNGGTIISLTPSGSNYPCVLTSFSTGSTSGNTAYMYSNAAGTTTGWAPAGKNILYIARVWITTAVTSVRIRCGMAATASPTTWLGTDTITTVPYAAFRFSTNASDTNWMCETGSGSAANVVSSGVAVAQSTAYTLQIQFNDSTPNVVFTINGTVVYTSTTDLPGTSGTAFSHFEGVETLSNAVRNVSIGWIYEEADN